MTHIVFEVLAAVVLVVVLFAVAQYLAVHKAYATSEVIMHAAIAYEQHPAHPTAHVLVAGDSTGVGTGSVDNTKSIAGRIGADFPRVDITNVSVNGLKLIGLVDILQKNNEQYDLVVFQIGANDVTGRTPYADIHAQLAQALQWSDTHARHTVVLTAGNVGSSPVFYWPFSTYITQRTLATRALFMQLVGEHSSAQYIDLYQPRKRDVFVQDPATYFAADHFHPSAAGYGVWYQSVGPQIAGIL